MTPPIWADSLHGPKDLAGKLVTEASLRDIVGWDPDHALSVVTTHFRCDPTIDGANHIEWALLEK